MLAICYITNKFIEHQNLNEFISVFKSSKAQLLLIIVFGLQFLNWTLEALKLSILLPKSQNINFKLILKAIYVGNFTALFTPERLGNFIGRSWVLHQTKKDTITYTLIGNYAQFGTTIIMAFFSLFMILFSSSSHQFYLPNKEFLLIIYLLLSILILISFINLKWVKLFHKLTWLSNWKASLNQLTLISHFQKFGIISFSILRYFIFVFQFYALSFAFNLPYDFITIFTLLGVMFGVITLFPSLIPGNLGTKEALLIILLGGGVLGLKFSLISFIIWTINVGVAGLIGGGINLYRSKS